MTEEKPIKWGDQAAHFGSCFFLTLFTLGFGAPVVVLWAITREYYQRKRTMESVVKYEPSFGEVLNTDGDLGFKYFKRDLVVSYFGIVVGIVAAIPLYNWLF